eukprot:CAMPEP_0173103320 /NCGR_PEP_ID=MMETSP1102-20130122/38274_1 /TAXON_ID=49646 /ORGANISM="Geminigera sp., Strain Caron Lab Isolate" /LENGTH=83 /DNA_ID=CAMNT_0013998021 /DNA_START=219 /DNA_END=467 /DNA_ORIENTATION=-
MRDEVQEMYSVFQPAFPVFKLPQSKEQNVMVEIIEGTRREMLRRIEIVETSKRAERAEKESKRSPSINAHDKLMHPTAGGSAA